MQNYSELVSHPTGTLESIAVRTAVNTLTPPERHGSAPRREYCPGKRGPYRYRVVPSGQRRHGALCPSPKAAPAQSQELIVWRDPFGAGQPSRACSQGSCTCELKATSSTL